MLCFIDSASFLATTPEDGPHDHDASVWARRVLFSNQTNGASAFLLCALIVWCFVDVECQWPFFCEQCYFASLRMS